MKLLYLSILGFLLFADSVKGGGYEQVKITAWEHIWVGDDISEIYKTKASVPVNSTFFEFMVETAKNGHEFEFVHIDRYKGHNKFITKIGDAEQVPNKNLYWLIFILDKPPNKNKPPGKADLSPLSVGNLIVQDKKHYLWWLRTANLF